MTARGLVLLLSLCAAACYPANPALVQASAPDPRAYRFKNLAVGANNSDEVFVILTFSGGGTRAAALAYGALQGLRDSRLAGGRSLLDEVDAISSVSGGSFAAAYLGLFGQREFFAKFKQEVLYRKLEYGLAARAFAPWNWPALLSPWFARSDLADRYYDRAIFRLRTFSDLPRQRPFILLNATDISAGAQFSFTQEHFDRLCSDLSGVHVSRGVTASSAFPVAFTPLTLNNYAKDVCGYVAPEWVVTGADSPYPPQRDLARTWRSYEDAQHRRYIHLSDGGLSDNLGLRAVFDAIALDGADPWSFLERVNERNPARPRIKQLVVIAVDAKPRPLSRRDQSARPPGIYTVLNAAASNPMENYSADTLELIRKWFEQWDSAPRDFARRRDNCNKLARDTCEARGATCEEAERQRCYVAIAPESLRPVLPELHMVHLRFEAIPDERVKAELENVDTRLQLAGPQVDRLVDWGCRLLDESESYQRVLQTLGAQKATCPGATEQQAP